MNMRAMTKWMGLGGGALAVTASLAIASAPMSAEAASPDDVANVSALLEGMRGTAPIPCAFALAVVEGNAGWGNWYGAVPDGTDPAVARLRRWLDHRLTDPSVVPMLRSALGPGDACVRQTAARLLGRTQHPRAVAALIEAAGVADASTRELAVLGLGLSDAPGAYDPLVGALRDGEPGVRAAAANALGRLGDHRAMVVLVPVLRNDRIPVVRRAAAYALGELD